MGAPCLYPFSLRNSNIALVPGEAKESSQEAAWHSRDALEATAHKLQEGSA